MRKTIDQKNQEIVQLMHNQVEAIEKAKRDLFFSMETEFQNRETKAFQKYDA